MLKPTSALPGVIRRPFGRLWQLRPRLGAAGTHASMLHYDEDKENNKHSPWNQAARDRLLIAVSIGTLGSILIAIGGLGAGAFPVIGNPYWEIPLLGALARMLHTTTVMCFVGIGLLVLGWTLLARFTLPRRGQPLRYLPQRFFWRIFFCWVTPLMFTAPLFTQDIYSYLAQGAITAQGLDPYSGGPVDLLGVQHELARSVPLMWSYSPAPYGPVALGYGALISLMTDNSILWGILSHRIVAIIGLAMSAWALIHLARRCHVAPQTALWIGVLNPLAILHLIGGIHNESAMMGLLLVGLECVLRGCDKHSAKRKNYALICLGFMLITMAGMVKVTALIGLGFAGVAVCLWLGGRLIHLAASAVWAAGVAALSIVLFSVGSGAGFGWITSQGGAADIVSWMSLTTLTGLASNFLALQLGLGDHFDSSLALFRGIGLLIAGLWLVRMLWAAYRQRIHPIGALGLATLLLIFFFPVVQPWYLLWAIMPLAAWVNRRTFQQLTVLYSTAFSFTILPRGLGLPPMTVVYIYVMSLVSLALLFAVGWWWISRRPDLREALNSDRVRDLRTRTSTRMATRSGRLTKQRTARLAAKQRTTQRAELRAKSTGIQGESLSRKHGH